jgi:hypothetical protein
VSVQDWQIVLPTGVTVGAGTAVNIMGVDGLRDLTGLRSGDIPRAQSDGVYPGLNLLGERPVTIKWELTLAPGGVENALQILAAGFQNVPDPSTVCMTAGDYLRQQAGVGAIKPVSMLQVKLPGRAAPFFLFGRPTKHTVPIDLNYQFGQVHPVSEWTSSDGTIYDGTVVTGTVGLPTPSTGLAWPAPFPWTFGASTGGSITLNNTGAYAARPVFILQGPLSYPTISNQNTGQFIKLNIVLGASDVVVIDHQAGVVTLNSNSNRNNTVLVGSSFFACAPGATTIGFASGDSVAVTGTLTASIFPTYSAA